MENRDRITQGGGGRVESSHFSQELVERTVAVNQVQSFTSPMTSLIFNLNTVYIYILYLIV